MSYSFQAWTPLNPLSTLKPGKIGIANLFSIHPRLQISFLAAFVCLNSFIFILKTENGGIQAATDAATYMFQARSIIRHGGIVELDHPNVVVTWNTPVYPVLLAGSFLLFGEQTGLQAIVLLQVAVLYATALLLWVILLRWSLMVAAVAQAIVLFNPNSLLTAHLIQTETLFTFFLGLVLLGTLLFASNPSCKYAAFVGFFAGLATMTRPALYYAIPFLPLFMTLVLAATRISFRAVLQGVGYGVISMLIAGSFVGAWIARNYHHTGVAALTSNGGEYLWDNVFEVYRAQGSYDTENLVHLKWERIKEFAQNYPDFENLHQIVKSRILFRAGMEELSSLSFEAMVKAEAISLARLYFSGGSGNVWRLFGLENTFFAGMQELRGFRSYVEGLGLFFAKGSIWQLVIHGMPIGIAIALRVLGIAGFIWLLLERRWSLVIVIGGTLLYFTGMYMFLGQSRFRVPLEPVLAVLSSFGFSGLRSFIRTTQFAPSGLVTEKS